MSVKQNLLVDEAREQLLDELDDRFYSPLFIPLSPALALSLSQAGFRDSGFGIRV